MKTEMKRRNETLTSIRTAMMATGDTKRLTDLLGRFNTACKHYRQRNLNAGMPGQPWVNISLTELQEQLSKQK